MSINAALARRLEEISRFMDLLGEDSFRASAHARAARAIEDLPQDVAALAESREALLAVEGVGPKIADKIIEFVKTGTIREHEELAARVPPGLPALMNIPGLGPKTVRVLWQQGGVTDLAGLKRIIDDGSILNLPRMGAKAVEKIRQSIAFAAQGQERLNIGIALPIAEAIVERLARLPGVESAHFAGSLRRGKETVGDLDLLVALTPAAQRKKGAPADIGEAFRTMPEVTQVLAAGETKSSVRISVDLNDGRWGGGEGREPKSGRTIQADLRVVPRECLGAALMYFTGSKEHNVALRERALRMKTTLNEYGLFPLEDGEPPPQERGVKPIAAATEPEIYQALGLPWIPPELREHKSVLELTETPRLVEVAHVKAELHAHTTASDGSLSIEELAGEAKSRGFHTIAVTDHSKSSAIAGGLSVDALLEHVENVRAAAAKVKGITILAGSEVDILADGTLDYDDKVLAKLDLVIASPHAALSQDEDAATKRLLRAIRNRHVKILGHPTGRLINRRSGLSPRMGELFSVAAERGIALEINAHWMRLDLRDTHAHEAVRAGCLVAINCDVHARDDFANLRYGVLTARRAGVPPERCINTWDAGKLHAWLGAHRK